MVHTRRCKRCSVALSPWQRSDALFCSGSCRVAAHRARHTDDPASVIPSVLRDRARWVRHDAKRPITVTGRAASSTNARTWSTYAAASASTAGDGLGFVLAGDGIACLDLDKCLTDDGGVMPWAAAVLASCPADTYVEVSPGGAGLHIWGFAELSRGRVLHVDGGKVECYDRGRFMTVTGQRFAGAPSQLADLSAVIAQVTHH